MFGRGQRDDLDDEEGEKLAFQLRAQIRQELQGEGDGKSKL